MGSTVHKALIINGMPFVNQSTLCLYMYNVYIDIHNVCMHAAKCHVWE